MYIYIYIYILIIFFGLEKWGKQDLNASFLHEKDQVT